MFNKVISLLVALKILLVGVPNSAELAYAPDAGLFAVSAGYLAARAFRLGLFAPSWFAIFCLLLLLLTVLLSAELNGTSALAGVISLVRTATPFLLFLALSDDLRVNGVAAVQSTLRLGVGIALLAVGLTLYGINAYAPNMNRGEQWLPTFFGGLHESAYIVASASFLAFAAFRLQPGLLLRVVMTLCAAFTFYMLFFGWGVRTVGIVFFGFLVFSYLVDRGFRPAVLLLVLVSGAVAVILSMLAFDVLDRDSIVHLTSGRIAMYEEKLQFYETNSFGQWMFGRGAGSDLMVSEIWWWGAKGSHNDYLTFLTESGFVFMVAFATLMLNLMRNMPNVNSKILFAFALLSSMGSNGYLTRPAGAYGLMIAVALLSANTRPRALVSARPPAP